jgi:hypothetical protein
MNARACKLSLARMSLFVCLILVLVCLMAGCKKDAPQFIAIDPSVRNELHVSEGEVLDPDQLKNAKTEFPVKVALTIPDESKVVGFKNPHVTCQVESQGSERLVTSVGELSATGGSRRLSFRVALTAGEQKTLKRILVTRIFEQ